jgi:BASS family bile acid:Na+ symporter
MSKVGSLGIMVLLVVGLGLNASNVISLIGTRGFLAILLFIAGSLAIGFGIGGREPGIRNVTGLGTAQRNVTAALVVALKNFGGTDTVTFTLMAAILIPLILLPLAKRLGSRIQPAAPPAVADVAAGSPMG